jgi:hypothetical protein
MPLDLVLWHDDLMSKSSDENDTDTGGGIASAIVQDVELTIEQAEDAAKRAAHAAAVALGLSKDEAPVAEPSSTVPTDTANDTAATQSPKPKA